MCIYIYASMYIHTYIHIYIYVHMFIRMLTCTIPEIRNRGELVSRLRPRVLRASACAVYSSVLQCVAVCCSVSKCVAERYSVLQCVTMSRGSRQKCVAVCCREVCCRVLQGACARVTRRIHECDRMYSCVSCMQLIFMNAMIMS